MASTNPAPLDAGSETSPASASIKPPRVFWPSFDLLRGLAAVLMVVNHVGLMLTAPDAVALIDSGDDAGIIRATPLQWAVFLGAFAPVVFFFVTGLGYGIQSDSAKPKPLSSLFEKVLILLLADALMWRTAGFDFGLDFFGFIAVSMVLLTVLLQFDRAASPRRVAAFLTPSVWLAGLLLGLVLGLRFVVGPVAERVLGMEQGGWLDVVTGRNIVPVEGGWAIGWSFPPIPWLVYPLAGFVLGAWLRARRAWLLDHRGLFGLVVLAGGVVCVAGLAVLLMRGGILHRWGTMSVASVLAGFATLSVLIVFSVVLCERKQGKPARLVGCLSLRGIAAFAVVPLHFLLIGLASWAGWRPDTSATIWLAIGVAVVVSMAIAPRFVPLGKSVAKAASSSSSRTWLFWLLGLALPVALLIVVTPATVEDASLRRVLVACGQLVLCVMLVLPPLLPRKTNAR